jgi:NADH-quinone oxidoreductase subunit G
MATIEIDGKTFEVENGKMIIEVADEAGIHIPRFCYHKKLSVAANCRMCLVEIENSKKTVPACATPINQGMKVFTQSVAALKSQKIIMEFLLINHPLDCPVCDQGGECELQDVSMGFGSDRSDYSETKRSVDDKNLGSLIETEMTRCIHCTRCVRFGEEIAGLREMGAPFRGEDVKIGTYVETSIRSEISANIIDLCPVGALTSKPYRFAARSWELNQHPGIAAHDCLGTNVYLHTRRGKLMRVIPRELESINETWISDRDRFSYTSNYVPARLAHPMIKKNGKWQVVDWSAALNFTASKLGEILAHHGPESVAAFASPSSTTEELYILQKWMRALKVQNLDFRLHQNDFSSDKQGGRAINNTIPYAKLDNANGILLLGTHINREVPLAAARIRKAFLNGARIASINLANYRMPFDLETSITAHPGEFEEQLLTLIHLLKLDLKDAPDTFKKLVSNTKPSSEQKQVAELLNQENVVIVTGAIFENHPQYASLKVCMNWIVKHSEIQWVHLPFGANSHGAWTAGFVPHLTSGYHPSEKPGMNVDQALSKSLKAYILHGVEPSHDFANPKLACEALNKAEFVLSLSSFKTDDLLEHADIILPIASLGETSGTFVNIDGTWQSFEGCATPFEQARPAWKIYRVLANLSHCDGFEYHSSTDLLDELKNQSIHDDANSGCEFVESQSKANSEDIIKVSMPSLYASDYTVRNSLPLQQAASADQACVKVHPRLAEKLKLGSNVTVSQEHNKITLPLELDDRLHENVVVIPAVGSQWNTLGRNFEKVSLK